MNCILKMPLPGETEGGPALGDAECEADPVGEALPPHLVIHPVREVLQHHPLRSSLATNTVNVMLLN